MLSAKTTIMRIFCNLFFFIFSFFVFSGEDSIPVEKIQSDWRVVIVPTKNNNESTVAYVEIFPHGDNLDSNRFAVTNPDGGRVNAKLLWSAKGEPMKILFDATSNAKYYSVYFGDKISQVKTTWMPRAGLILETKKREPGNANNWREAQEIIAKSKIIEGRSPVDKIFHGINPHGKTFDIIAYYKGYLKIDPPGEYKFAIAADDATFLLIDDKKVTEWPGWHGPWEGVNGKFSGNIFLDKGIHKIEYYNIQNGAELNMVCGWQIPGKKYLEPIDSKAFVHFKEYSVDRLEFKGQNVPSYFQWKRISHLMVKGKSLINMDFKLVNPPSGLKCEWHFDDSSVSSELLASHLFLSPGLRKVRLELRENGELLSTTDNFVNVVPLWCQREEYPKHVQTQCEGELSSCDFSKLPVSDILNLTDILEIVESRKLLAKMGVACLKRKKDFADNPSLFYKLSKCYIHHSIREYGLTEQAYQATLEYAGEDQPLISKTKLYYAALLIHNYGKYEEGIKLLQDINDEYLSPFEKRKKQVWLADGYMTKGDINAVEAIYSKLSDLVDKKQNISTILNEARILNMMDCLRNKDYDAAEELIWLIEWEYPRETMNSHTGLAMTKIFIAREEYNYALWRCTRMMNVTKNSRQMSDIMLTLINVYNLTGKKDDAVKLSKKLLKEFPYSEAAAILKGKNY